MVLTVEILRAIFLDIYWDVLMVNILDLVNVFNRCDMLVE